MSSSLLQMLGGQGDPALMSLIQRAQQAQQPPQQPPMPQMAPVQAPQGISPQPMAVPRPQPQNQPGLLSRFSSGVLNTLAPHPGEGVQGLIGPDAIRAAQKASLLSLGANLLSQSGWSQRPISLGEALGNSIQASQKQYGASLNTAVDNATNAQNAASWAEQRRGLAVENQARARTLATTEYQRQAILRDAPAAYAPFKNLDWKNMSDQDALQNYRAMYFAADHINDDARRKSLAGMITNLEQHIGSGKADVPITKMGGNGQQLQYMGKDATGQPIWQPFGDPRPDRPTPINISLNGEQKYGGQIAKMAQNQLNRNTKEQGAADAQLQELQNTLTLPADRLTGGKGLEAIFQFVKSFSPTQRVTESELKELKASDPIFEHLSSTGTRLETGSVVSPVTIKRMLESTINFGLLKRQQALQRQRASLQNIGTYSPDGTYDNTQGNGMGMIYPDTLPTNIPGLPVAGAAPAGPGRGTTIPGLLGPLPPIKRKGP